jgi:hypothetical protein
VEHHRALRVGVLGWIGRGNVGDELLRAAICNQIQAAGAEPVPLSGTLTPRTAAGLHGLIIGGGSLLDGPPDIDPSIDMAYMPLAYVSVGLETSIHHGHHELLKRARLVVHRSSVARGDQIKQQLGITDAWVSLPDAVFTLPSFRAVQNSSWASSKRLLVLPNVETVPDHTGPHWSHVGWELFKNEFAQFLDDIVADGWLPEFVGCCLNPYQDDAWPAAEIIGRMRNRRTQFLRGKTLSTLSTVATATISSYRAVISQRFHGAILSRMANVPCLSIHHHDKLRPDEHFQPTAAVPFNAISKADLHVAFRKLLLSGEQYVPPTDGYDAAVRSFIDGLEVK